MKNYLKYLFSALSIGLTLISMHSGFYFYLNMFDITTAVLATSVFEILRLATLYSLVMWEVRKRLVSGTLYALVAFICAFAATSSFHARIIESHTSDLTIYHNEMDKRLKLVKEAYAKHMGKKIAEVEDNITYTKRKVAAFPNSTYWPTRVEQWTENRLQLIAERDSVLVSVPEGHLEDWLNQQAAVLGIAFEPLPVKASGSNAISLAIQELWAVRELTVKKIVAILITIGIEIGIVLLATFAKLYSNPQQTEPEEVPEEEETETYTWPSERGESQGYTWPSERSNGGASYTWPSERKEGDSYVWPSERGGEGEQTTETETTPAAGAHDSNTGFFEIDEETVEQAEHTSEPAEENDDRESGAAEEDPAEPPEEGSDRLSQMVDKLRSRFSEDLLEQFFEKAYPHYRENGRLPSYRSLGKELREIKNFLDQKFAKEDLESLFDSHQAIFDNQDSKGQG